jgi:Fur family zinc uptake transcriptional regulator
MGGRKGGWTAAYVLEMLVTPPRPLNAYDLMAKLTPLAIASPPTVYRALKRLISDGKVHRIESLNAFIACSHARGIQLDFCS